jgi:hypothetical protein
MPIRKLLNRIRSLLSRAEESEETEPTELYHEMTMDIRDVAQEQNTKHIQPKDIWDAAFRNGFDQQLSENPDLAAEFLIITDRGPTWHYQKYLSRAEDSDDILSLVALSALVNDALH